MNSKAVYMSFSLLIVLAAATYFFFFQTKTISREDVHSVQVKSETIDSGIELESEYKAANLFTSQITYPFTKIEAIDVPIKQWVVEQENAFYNELEQLKFIFSKNIAASFVIDTDVTKVDDQLFSFQLKQEQSLHKDEQLATIKTFVIDLKDEKIIELQDVMTLNEENIKQLRTYLKKKRKEQNLTVTQIDHLLESLSDTNFLLTEKELIFLLDEQLTNVTELQQTTIPFKDIQNMLTENYQKRLIPETKKPAKKQLPKLVALTFDDGPNDVVTPQILKILEKYDIKATFFMLAKSAEKYPEIAKLVAEQGHEIANHTISHPNLNEVKKGRIKKEILQAQAKIEEITGEKPTLFRPPYGEYNKTVLQTAKKSEQKVIMWSVDTYDWRLKNRKKIVKEIKKQTVPGSIILMHDVHQTTADSLEAIIKQLQKSGYEFVTVSELLEQIEPNKRGVYYGKAKKQ